MNLLITGGCGRLGAALSGELLSAGYEVVALAHAELDVTCTNQIAAVIDRRRPEVIINCAAYNAVDAAEADANAAFALNAQAPALLASAAARINALFVHFSSDFVFDGERERPYTESDPTNPVNVYGASKLAGEIVVRLASPRHYILRVESLFGGLGLNGRRATVDAMADLFLTGTTVRAAVDRTVTPSYVPDLVHAIRTMLERRIPYGTYHCVNSGSSTWYELACEAARQLGVEARIEPIVMGDVTTRARRARRCALSNEKLAAAGIVMPTWQSAIRRHLACRAATVGAVAGMQI